MFRKSLSASPSLLTHATVAFVLVLCAAAPLRAQSGDANFPTPVFNNEVVGRIAPRDLGDPRRTRHFYTFRGTEGDLVVNLETTDLLGDVDVFLAPTLRPLIKFTLFGDPARLTKSFYLRKEETLVLRVEARAVGDAEGSYRISFGGSFAPAPAGLAAAPEPPTLSASDARGKNTRRVTATGARIEEPKVEAPPREETSRSEASAESSAAAAPTPARTTRRGAAASRRGRATRPAPSRAGGGAATTPRTDTPPAEASETKSADDSAAPAASTPEAPATRATRNTPRRRAARTARRGSSRESTGAGSAEPSASQPSSSAAARPEPGAALPPTVTAQRLIIVTKDGETLEQDMSAVRRVTVENNQVVIVTRDGRVIRRPMASVLKMSIEP